MNSQSIAPLPLRAIARLKILALLLRLGGPFSVEVASAKIRSFVGLLVLGLIVATILVWQFRHELREIDIRAAIDWIAGFGPIPFFVAMAILPSFWAPVSPFLLLAGAIYDMPVAIGGSAAALATNMALSWLLAGKFFRPPFERLVHRFGYSVPELRRESMFTVAVLLRITPGMPFPLQNYLLGLARMPFLWYMGISLPLTLILSLSIVIFGDAILKGNTALILLAISLFVALSLGVRFLRARLRAKVITEEPL